MKGKTKNIWNQMASRFIKGLQTFVTKLSFKQGLQLCCWMPSAFLASFPFSYLKHHCKSRCEWWCCGTLFPVSCFLAMVWTPFPTACWTSQRVSDSAVPAYLQTGRQKDIFLGLSPWESWACAEALLMCVYAYTMACVIIPEMVLLLQGTLDLYF